MEGLSTSPHIVHCHDPDIFRAKNHRCRLLESGPDRKKPGEAAVSSWWSGSSRVFLVFTL